MENENKPMLSIDADGNVLKCAKGAAGQDCGYKAGASICAKCGAAPVQVKMVPLDSEEMDDMEEMNSMPKMKKKPSMSDQGEMMEADMSVYEGEADDMDDEDDDMEDEDDDMESESEDSMDDEKMAYYKKYGWAGYKKKYGKLPYMPEDEEMPMAEAKGMRKPMDGMRKPMGGMRKPMNGRPMPQGREDEPSMMDDMDDEDLEALELGADEEDEDMVDMEKMGMMRNRRIQSMGMKAEDFGADGYVCAIDRKAHPGGAAVCDNCPGGCIAEKGLPGLLHIEGLVEKEFKGNVIDSGYSAKADMFVVDVQVGDGSVNEVFINGTTAEIVGFHKLDDDILEKKSAYQDPAIIVGFAEAAEIAVKSIEGHVVAVEPDVFEGIDSYAVEIDALDGKSYDVFVSLDGEVLGYDKYEAEEAEEIEAEAAEIALKRAFSDEKRQQMAKEGMALPDGSYPIASEEDLRNAIQAFGRAKDKEAAKRHIMKRAKEMGKEKLIPANWIMGGDTSKKSDIIDSDFMASLVEFELLQSDIEDN